MSQCETRQTQGNRWMTAQEKDEALRALRDSGQPLPHEMALRIADHIASLTPPSGKVSEAETEVLNKARVAHVLRDHDMEGSYCPVTLTSVAKALGVSLEARPPLVQRGPHQHSSLKQCDPTCSGWPAPPSDKAKCPHCPHPAHVGMCTRRTGQSANPCPCLKDTPPSGPGGGESTPECMGEPCTKDAPTVGAHLLECPASHAVGAAEEWAQADRQNDAQRRAWATDALQRQRALTPTPVGDAIDQLAALLDESGLKVRFDPSQIRTQPEPAAPNVAWEGDGVRVLADGTWEREQGLTLAYAGDVLARALAEAKRASADDKDVAARALVQAVNEAAHLGAEDWKARAQFLWTAAWNARAHLHSGRTGDALAALSGALEAATTGAGTLPSFHLQPLLIRDQANGRHALAVLLNGVPLRIMGDSNDTVSRHLLCYLFSCEEMRLTVVREGKLAAGVGRPAVVSAMSSGEEVPRG